ncbi:hypothetical protein Glove_74g260 [Diversispora epigaea]|uniref:Uncharacterized protein n=1 Tax=Diversispora epigaea TaxID=1348612 RepID=A0A397J9E3_9GLOM|nr:hypothetical protein Glove_74g260 [Diversispora epigaea]
MWIEIGYYQLRPREYFRNCYKDSTENFTNKVIEESIKPEHASANSSNVRDSNNIFSSNQINNNITSPLDSLIGLFENLIDDILKTRVSIN